MRSFRRDRDAAAFPPSEPEEGREVALGGETSRGRARSRGCRASAAGGVEQLAGGRRGRPCCFHRRGALPGASPTQRVDEAVPILQELVAWRTRRHGARAKPTAAWRNELIQRLGQLGRYAEAEPFCRERLEVARHRGPPDARAVAFAQVTLAWCVRGQRRWDEAERLCREAVAALDSNPVPRGSVGWALASLAAVLLRRMELDEAETALKRAAEEWAVVGRADLVAGVEEQLMDLYVVGERHHQALEISEAALNRSRRGATAVADRQRQLRNLDRHAFLLSMGGRGNQAARYELRSSYVRQAVEAEPRAGDGASLDPSGPVFEGEPLLDWALPGMAVAARAC